jgi:pimeloyl-ACP methyl ester carboxylesterase
MEPIQHVFAAAFATIAVDMPGMGLSEPLGKDQLQTEDIADAIVDLLDVLRIEQAAFYGRHTGAGVAVEIAHRHPGRVSMVLTDGFPVFENPYPEDRLDGYLGRIDPKWDGSHLPWIWFRCRDVHVFWPWDKRVAGARADTDVPGPDAIHRGTLELLEAGNEFRKVYASAFRHAGLGMIGGVVAPVCYGNRPGDSQFHTMAKYPATAWTMEFPRDVLAAAVAEREVLKLHPPRSTLQPSSGDFAPESPQPEIGYLAWEDEQVLLRTSGFDQPGIATLILHDLPGSSALHADILSEIGRFSPAIAMDFAGQGESGSEGPVSIGRWCDQIGHVIDTLGHRNINLLAIGASAGVAVEFALRRPDAVSRLVLQSPPALDAAERNRIAGRYAVSADPEWDGGHLVRVFHHLRDQELWWPWFERNAANVRTNEPRLDPAELTLRLRECVKQPRNYKPVWETVLSHALIERMSLLKVETRIVWNEDDLFGRFHQIAALRIPAGQATSLPREIAGQAKILSGLLTD